MSTHPLYAKAPDGTLVLVGRVSKAADGYVCEISPLVIGSKPMPAAGAASAGGGPVFPPYGRKKGEPVAGAAEGDLRFYANGCIRSLGDSSKSRFHAKERALLDAINEELTRQGLAPVEPPEPGEEAPEGGYSDIPI